MLYNSYCMVYTLQCILYRSCCTLFLLYRFCRRRQNYVFYAIVQSSCSPCAVLCLQMAGLGAPLYKGTWSGIVSIARTEGVAGQHTLVAVHNLIVTLCHSDTVTRTHIVKVQGGSGGSAHPGCRADLIVTL